MMPDRYVQSFTDGDSGVVERITTEPLEFWTANGWEVIPAGFRFRSLDVPFFRLDPEETLLCLLYQWRRTVKRTPCAAAVWLLRRDLIKYTLRPKGTAESGFWAKLKNWARIAAICLLTAVKK